MPVPALSIVIPAFEYADGVRRILKNLSEDRPSSVEILIFDDSFSDEISNVVREWGGAFREIIYRRNCPSLGASGNWNALLESARGEYCLLMHHDEIPLGAAFVQRALDELRENPGTDVLMMDCVLVHGDGKVARRHLPHLIRSWVVRHSPRYLFRRNVIGPTSALIVRRRLYPKFDDKLRWLIDVDVYYRLRQSTARWRLCKHLQIGSLLGRGDSITAKMGAGIREIQRQEQVYLVQKHPGAGMWLRADVNRLARVSEAVLWALMRVSTRLYGRILGAFGVLPTEKMDLRKAFN